MKTKYYKKRKGRLRNVKRMKYIKIFLKKEKKIESRLLQGVKMFLRKKRQYYSEQYKTKTSK